MIILIGEVEAAVAAGASSLPFEEGQAPLCGRREGRRVPSAETVIRGFSGEDRPDVGGDRFSDALGAKIGPKDLPELLLIGLDCPQVLDHQFRGLVSPLYGLVLNRYAAASPMLLSAEEPIDNSRGVARGWLLGKVQGELLGIAPPVLGLVTTHAGKSP